MKKSLLYTRTGDMGMTSLVGGQRDSKASVRLEAYGTTDELSSWLGVLIAAEDMPREQRELMLMLQHKIFNIGAWLATQPESPEAVTEACGLGHEAIARLEQAIDLLDDAVPPLNRFVLPGGSQTAAWCNVARTVCRRAERRVVALGEVQRLDATVLRLLNRMSDYLFVLGRYMNTVTGTPEVFWEKEV